MIAGILIFYSWQAMYKDADRVWCLERVKAGRISIHYSLRW